MSNFNQHDLDSLGASASRAAAYLDACDEGATDVRLDPAYYLACGNLLKQIFSLLDAYNDFPRLLEHSAAARDVAESITIAYKIETSCLGFYPELSVLMNRVAV